MQTSRHESSAGRQPLTQSSSSICKDRRAISTCGIQSPLRPAEIRGEFRPIATRAPGMMLGEVLPMLADQAQHFTLIRSMGVNPKGLRNHGSAIYMLMTGTDPGIFR